MGFFKVAIVLAIIVASLVALFDPYLAQFYVFDQNELHQIAQKHLAKKYNSTEDLIHNLSLDISKKYPGHVELKQRWIFNNAGGAMGAMYVMHASISEYLIIFGTPIGTHGHTGRYLADDYFMILEGEQWAFSAGSLDRQVWKPGEMHHLPRGKCQAYRIPEHAWALEYARGWIPLMLPFGIIETFTSTLDFPTTFETLYIYAEIAIKQIMLGKI